MANLQNETNATSIFGLNVCYLEPNAIGVWGDCCDDLGIAPKPIWVYYLAALSTLLLNAVFQLACSSDDGSVVYPRSSPKPPPALFSPSPVLLFYTTVKTLAALIIMLTHFVSISQIENTGGFGYYFGILFVVFNGGSLLQMLILNVLSDVTAEKKLVRAIVWLAKKKGVDLNTLVNKSASSEKVDPAIMLAALYLLERQHYPNPTPIEKYAASLRKAESTCSLRVFDLVLLFLCCTLVLAAIFTHMLPGIFVFGYPYILLFLAYALAFNIGFVVLSCLGCIGEEQDQLERIELERKVIALTRVPILGELSTPTMSTPTYAKLNIIEDYYETCAYVLFYVTIYVSALQIMEMFHLFAARETDWLSALEMVWYAHDYDRWIACSFQDVQSLEGADFLGLLQFIILF